jgi:hypothetical protein
MFLFNLLYSKNGGRTKSQDLTTLYSDSTYLNQSSGSTLAIQCYDDVNLLLPLSENSLFTSLLDLTHQYYKRLTASYILYS